MKIPQLPNSQFRRKAFTLVEMLVSISIVIVLATIGFISMKKAKESAGAAVDAIEMRTISSAVTLYAADNGDLLPVTSGGVGPIWTKKSKNLCGRLAIYLGNEDPQEGDFFPEFAAASWQSAKTADNGPAMLVRHHVYAGPGRANSRAKPTPYIKPFGYPYGADRWDPMTLSAAMAKMTDPSNSLMLIEIDRLVPQLGNPGWIATVPEKLAHGTYRLGLYWDGHVGRLNVNLDPL